MVQDHQGAEGAAEVRRVASGRTEAADSATGVRSMGFDLKC
jgi:hypothetical protein